MNCFKNNFKKLKFGPGSMLSKYVVNIFNGCGLIWIHFLICIKFFVTFRKLLNFLNLCRKSTFIFLYIFLIKLSVIFWPFLLLPSTSFFISVIWGWEVIFNGFLISRPVTLITVCCLNLLQTLSTETFLVLFRRKLKGKIRNYIQEKKRMFILAFSGCKTTRELFFKIFKIGCAMFRFYKI